MDGVIAGCKVTTSAPPDMNVTVAAGSLLVAGAVVAVAGGAVAVGAADAALPRIDLVKAANANGAVSVVAGVAAVNPVPPAIGAGQELALVYIPAAAASIGPNNIGDRRQFVGSVSTVFGRSGAVVAANGDYTPTQVGLPPQAAPANLTDSSGGVAGAILVAPRSDTLAHCAADQATNVASLNAQLNAVVTALKASHILT